MVGIVCSLASLCFAFPCSAEDPTIPADDEAVFFDDAFAELRGERPDYAAEAAAEVAASAIDTDAGSAAWSAWVDSDTIETEIKRQAMVLAGATSSAAKHRAELRAASDARGLVAILFAVTAEHEGAPRWADAAAALRGHFATGPEPESREANDEALADDKRRADDLADVVRGGRPDVPAHPAEGIDWGTLASRGAVMRRMGAAEETRLVAWLAERRTFARRVDEVRHEAQVLALLAEATHRPGAPDSDDEGYATYAERLRDAATELGAAAGDEDYPRAQEALKRVIQSCADCHEDYRG
ncbi:MAG: cytochrome c [Lacipirellulaceae bacterium]